MRSDAIQRWSARGAGFAAVLAVAIPLSVSEAPPAKAASPVCFTVYGKCFCVDFFTTEFQDQAWGRLQDKMNSLYEDFREEQLNTRLLSVLPDVMNGDILASWEEYGGDLEAYLKDRGLEEMGVSPEALATSSSILDDHPEITNYLEERGGDTSAENVMLPKVRAIAYAYADPASLSPYRANTLDAQSTSHDADTLTAHKAWADRMMLVPEPPEGITDESLAGMSIDEVDGAYLQARQHVAGTMAHQALLAPMTKEADIVALEAQREELASLTGKAGASVSDYQSSNVLAEVMQGRVLLKRLESNLRQERLMGAVIALDQEQAAQEARP